MFTTEQQTRISNFYSQYNISRFYTRVNRERISHTLNRYLGNMFEQRNDYELSEEQNSVYNTMGKLMSIISSINPSLQNLFQSILDIKDRSSSDNSTSDPLANKPQVGLAYFPKGLTIFETNKPYLTEVSSVLQKTVVKSTGIPVTIKAYGDDSFINIYFNKYDYKILEAIFVESLKIYVLDPKYKGFIDVSEDFKDKYYLILSKLIFWLGNEHIPERQYTSEDALNDLLDYIEKDYKQILDESKKDVLSVFVKNYQTRMNSRIKQKLGYTFQQAKNDMQEVENRWTSCKEKYMLAELAVNNFKEINQEALGIFLEKINKSGRCVHLNISDNTLYFHLLQPIEYTDEKLWSKILSNPSSDIKRKITYYSQHNYNEYKTNPDTLDFAITKVLSHLFVEKTVQIQTLSCFHIRDNSDGFYLDNNSNMPSDRYIPHPHIMRFNCWSTAKAEIKKAILNNDGNAAYAQLEYATQQLTASDGTVTNAFIDSILSKRNVPAYFKKDNPLQPKTIYELITEEVQNETNKINANDDNISNEEL